MSHLDLDKVGPAPKSLRAVVPLEVVAPVIPSDRPRPAGEPALATTTPKIHITCQFRDGMAMVYDLKSGQCRVELRVQASTTPASWSVAMTVKTGGTSHSQSAEGTTRRSALEALERSFGDSLSPDEWNGLREALADVRALDPH